MYIRKTTSRQGTKTYTNYLLVESVATPKGPRQKIICSLGNLKPRPREEWLQLARKVERALSGQADLFPEEKSPEIQAILEKVDKKNAARKAKEPPSQDVVEVYPDKVEAREIREVGPLHVGYQMYLRLGMDEVLKETGFSKDARRLTLAMILNRLIAPKSEHAMPEWFASTALSDLLGPEFSCINDDKLYRNLDRLYPNRERIEAELVRREESLFNLDNTVLLYDVTSTYFEGRALKNEKAKRGYSSDGRPDCPQVVIGLVTDGEGFPRCHEVFDGNRTGVTTLPDMLDILGRRVGLKKGGMVVMDRGMASDENLRRIKERELHYLVAARQKEREQWLAEFEEENGWREICRKPSLGRIWVKAAHKGEESYALCISEGRKEKDRAIRERQEKRFIQDLTKLARRVKEGKLKKEPLIYEAIGRLKERYPRVSRYYEIEYEKEGGELKWRERPELRKMAEDLDGGYLLKTNRTDMEGEELWRIYTLLTRIEAAFRDMKSPLMEQPVFHQLAHRVETHIFLCVLAYHLLVSIEHTLRGHGDHRSWETVREALRTHQVVTVVLPATSGEELHVRRGARPEPVHLDIYKKLGVPAEPIKPVKTWRAVSSG